MSTFLKSCGVKLLNCTEGGAALPTVDQLTFGAALGRFAQQKVSIQGQIESAYQAWVPPGPEVFDSGIKSARRHMELVERQCRRGTRSALQGQSFAPGTRSQGRIMDALRRVGRAESKLRTQLLALPWLGAMMQAEIHQSVVQQRVVKNVDPTPDQALEEALLLFRGTLAGVSRGRKLMSELDRVLLEGGSVPLSESSAIHGVAPVAP